MRSAVRWIEQRGLWRVAVDTTLLLLLLSPLAVSGGDAPRDSGFLYCGVCRAMVKELRYDIRQVDPKRMIQVGSYRIDPDGSQRKRHEVPYARSTIHVHELVEKVCEQLPSYGLYTGPQVSAEEMQIVRGANREGRPYRRYHGKVASGENMGKKLRATCEVIVEDYEDDIVSLFNTNGEHTLCSQVVEQCAKSSEVENAKVPPSEEEEEEMEVVEDPREVTPPGGDRGDATEDGGKATEDHKVSEEDDKMVKEDL